MSLGDASLRSPGLRLPSPGSSCRLVPSQGVALVSEVSPGEAAAWRLRHQEERERETHKQQLAPHRRHRHVGIFALCSVTRAPMSECQPLHEPGGRVGPCIRGQKAKKPGAHPVPRARAAGLEALPSASGGWQAAQPSLLRAPTQRSGNSSGGEYEFGERKGLCQRNLSHGGQPTPRGKGGPPGVSIPHRA